MFVCVAVTVDSWKLESKFCMNNNSSNKNVTNTIKWNSEIINNFFNPNGLKMYNGFDPSQSIVHGIFVKFMQTNH